MCNDQKKKIVSLIVGCKLSKPVEYGLEKICEAIKSKGIDVEKVLSLEDARGDFLIAIGIDFEGGFVKRLLDDLGIIVPSNSESLVIHRTRWNNKPLIIIGGSDDRGLMYAELEVADRIAWAQDSENPFSEIEDTVEKPEVTERALSKCVMNKSEFERYFFSEEYWDKYFHMLARYRYNTFVLIFGFNSAGYFSPPYPYLFDVEEFPEVKVVGITSAEQKRNLEMLNRVIKMAHERGLNVTIAIWTHIYRGIREPTEGLVWGLTDENLIPYTKRALKKFLELVKGIDAIQFRVHTESSVILPQQPKFWKAVFETIKESGKNIRIDLRVKGLTEDLLDLALSTGLKIRLATKYWGEQMGLPYHPTHDVLKDQFSRARHSYADLLRYPRRYKMHWRLWNLGTTRILLWGDPEYVRRFVESTHLWDGDGFEIAEPLAFKMAHHRGETYDVLKPEYQYYKWEFERYWHFYQLWGLIGYNLSASPRIWQIEFERRFGKEAAIYIEQALHKASWVLPLIIAYNLRDLSADYAWPEKQRWENLPIYAMSEPSDTAQFVGIAEAARYILEGKESAKIWPQKVSEWFTKISNEVLNLIEIAEKKFFSSDNKDEKQVKEFKSTVVDLKILAYLARYHAKRIYAGLNWALFHYSKDLNALDNAIKFEEEAVEIWREIVKITHGVYHDNLIMGKEKTFLGSSLTGSWSDELKELEKELRGLKEFRENFKPDYSEVVAKFDFGDGSVEEGYLPVRYNTKYDPVKGGYGWVSAWLAPSLMPRSEPVEKESDRDFIHGPDPLRDPLDTYTCSSFAVDLPNGHYELHFTIFDSSQQPKDYGPMWIVANGMDSTGRFIVPAGKKVEKILRTTVTDNRLVVVFNSNSDAKWLVNSMIVKRVEPFIAHVPIRKAVPGKEIVIFATINGPDPFIAKLVYGNRKKGYRSIIMENIKPYIYRAAIPQDAVAEGLEYFIEVVDNAGRRVVFPRNGDSNPISVIVTSDNEPPIVNHKPVVECFAGKPLKITCEVSDPSGVKWVRLRYRGVNQHQDFRTLEMLPIGEGNLYQAEIPAGHIRPEWDLMYYIEVMDDAGNGKICPDIEKETPYIVVRVKAA